MLQRVCVCLSSGGLVSLPPPLFITVLSFHICSLQHVRGHMMDLEAHLFQVVPEGKVPEGKVPEGKVPEGKWQSLGFGSCVYVDPYFESTAKLRCCCVAVLLC
jgi:hypothetical protein